MKGKIIDIKRFAVHDGDGIRTTLFLKGCPLKCKWCHNPESISFKGEVAYYKEKCISCGECGEVCLQNAHTVSEEGHIFDRKKCIACGKCEEVCLGGALIFYGREMTVEEAVKALFEDREFYENSGGGITLSGGECMCQPDFAEALLRELKKSNIHVAAETTGYIEPSVFRRLAPLFDLLLFDIKHFDSKKHWEGTGVHNELIIQNLTWAHQNGISILPRIPVIPGFNSELSDGEGICNLLMEIGLKEAQLLPFHQFGERKYELLNQEYAFKDVKALYPENLTDYKQIFLDKNIHCFI